ncbi:hypothetical protein BAY60_08295 [Prauserella muralis]|uniref:B12-binding domain-containing protein n=1 Tax=Prauserella muralis TaxID=588067 RepID=A0A2V4BBP9_9PSEU|nr:hypothetical protein BAY60_08295 [Prauserella muralis]
MTRVVLAELDGAQPGALPLGRALRDTGAEVIHAGVLRTAAELRATVEQEDPDVVVAVVGSEPGHALATRVAGELPGVPLLTFPTDTDVHEWVAGSAICATDPSSQACR